MKSSLLVVVALALGSLGRSQPMSLKEVLGPNNSFNDARYGVSVTYPQGWAVRDAQRWGKNNNGENTVFFAPAAPSNARPSMYYQMFTFGAPAPEPGKTEAYFRAAAEWKENSRIGGGLNDYRNVPASFAFKQIAGRPAGSYCAVFTSGGRVMEEYFVRIVGAKGYVMFFVQGTAEDVEAIRADVDRMAATVQVP